MLDITTPKNRQVAIVLAFASMTIPVAGFHKFYLGQPVWGLVYLLLSWTPIPHIASAIEAVWYLTQDSTHFDGSFNSATADASTIVAHSSVLLRDRTVATVSDSIRELDKLRADGLISEYEFEQKRRQWLDRA
ncbi:NINE protein [Chamaesiphon minutus]|uniref:Putative membrane protein n=1 Tax=Chamaesiphon minutus (strain ATCC 27169 / PCC 6605) TaxID=1173020 RepID=K9UQ55_CHAP6|nr:NINE protein [Chamaesiphon minutus]AFY96339.1 putative membrane protein [Chamaesiphon minutus PCC 6605]